MPHLIYRGQANLIALRERFVAVQRNCNGWIIKLVHCYLSEDNRLAVFECLSVRSGFSQNYYVRAEQKGETVTIRVDPLTNVEKNEGVKRTLVVVRELLLCASPALQFEKTNLAAELLEAPAGDAP